ncbi:poly(A)-specific ribonuclease PNLDC1 isoform X3 [Aquila chrysaetos chrysaetos]|uniref:poly(A)-specific ribonuclease PNLDC1 isoform X3 n=1 Tax=Aquila chrysaetos chrysaetos TaxID=223781 RepID=UPI0011770DBE|nr:poly(A)-specific ribonuclease PNLDC1 isoform X3 [Aquila chrysaetos chrysaetos]
MEVGAADFQRGLPRLRGRVRRAAFLALDMEFTGLHSTFPQNNQPSLFDSPAERYLKARQSVQRFTVTQLGLAIFSNENSNKYVVHSYNFFLFPSMLGVTDVEFTLSASSIQFLSHYGFDYNKFLKDGIPYMNEVQEKILSQHLLEGSWKVSSALDRDVLKKAIDEVTRWIGAAEEEETMILQDLSGSQIFEVQLVLRQALPNVWTQPLGDKVMVKKVSPQHRQLLENSPDDCCQKELILLSARGFTNLFQTLVKAKKPLVGHNMLMDLMHLHDKFYKPLPESYEEFKRNIHNLFPVLIDTKTITKSIWKKCQFPPVSNLLEVYATLCSSKDPKDPTCPVIALASDCSKYAEKKSPHEAGYDAFLCGSVLLKSAHLLLCRFTDDAAEADPSFSQYLTVLAEYLNKVNFIRGGVSSINFSGEDAPCRHPPLLVVHVQGWPGLNERQIYQEFKALCRFDVRRLSKNQFILLSNKFKHVRLVLRDYKHHPHLRISVYRHWRHSPLVNCLLQVSSIVALWSLLAFVLGGAPCCSF